VTDTLSTGWADVEAAILADSAAGFTVRQIAARCGWGRQAVAGVLARHGMPVYSVGGAFVRGRQESRFVRWTDEEKAVVRTATSRADAQRLYRDAFPDSKRGPGAAARMWYTLRGTT